MEYTQVYYRRYDEHFEIQILNDDRTFNVEANVWDKFLRRYGTNHISPNQRKLSGLESVNQQALNELFTNR